MKTASYTSYKGTGRIRISVGRPWGIKWAEYESYLPLAPNRSWLGLPYDEYRPLFVERLQALNAQQVWDDLHALVPGHEPVLLCFEKPPLSADNWCHRQMVAEWFLEELGQEVAEFDPDLQPVTPARDEVRPTVPQQRLLDREDYVSPSSRWLNAPVSLEELQEQVERHYGALEAWRQAQRTDCQDAIDRAANEVELARRQVRAGWKRMSEIERALALQRRMIPVSVIHNL